MILKQVKEQGKTQKRLRIDINKGDNLPPGTDVVILTKEDYDTFKEEVLILKDNLTAKSKELEILQNQELNLKQIVEDTTAPIHEYYQKELQNKEERIKHLQELLKAKDTLVKQYNLDMMGLNAIEVLLLRKHKKLLQNFNTDFDAIGNDPKIIDVKPGESLPGGSEEY